MRHAILFALALALAACSSDLVPPADAGLADVGFDLGAADVGADAPAVDLDTNTPIDTGGDTGSDAPTVDAPAPVDATHVDASDDQPPAADVGADVPLDVPLDVRMACGGAMPDPPCRTHADCTACQPGAFGEPWCCAPNGFCAPSSNPTCD